MKSELRNLRKVTEYEPRNLPKVATRKKPCQGYFSKTQRTLTRLLPYEGFLDSFRLNFNSSLAIFLQHFQNTMYDEQNDEVKYCPNIYPPLQYIKGVGPKQVKA
jgi:hypothetical protein